MSATRSPSNDEHDSGVDPDHETAIDGRSMRVEKARQDMPAMHTSESPEGKSQANITSSETTTRRRRGPRGGKKKSRAERELNRLSFERPREYQRLDSDVQCNACSLAMRSQFQLNTHRVLFHEQRRLFLCRFRCTTCDASFRSLDAFLQHTGCSDIRRTRQTPVDVCVCLLCGVALGRKLLNDHVKNEHSVQLSSRAMPISQCGFCSSSSPAAFRSHNEMHFHMAVTHPSLLEVVGVPGGNRARKTISNPARASISPVPEPGPRAIPSKSDVVADPSIVSANTGDSSLIGRCGRCTRRFPSDIERAYHLLAHECTVSHVDLHCPYCDQQLPDNCLWRHIIASHAAQLAAVGHSSLTELIKGLAPAAVVAAQRQSSTPLPRCTLCPALFSNGEVRRLHIVIYHRAVVNNGDRNKAIRRASPTNAVEKKSPSPIANEDERRQLVVRKRIEPSKSLKKEEDDHSPPHKIRLASMNSDIFEADTVNGDTENDNDVAYADTVTANGMVISAAAPPPPNAAQRPLPIFECGECNGRFHTRFARTLHQNAFHRGGEMDGEDEYLQEILAEIA